MSDPGLPNFRIPFANPNGTVSREWVYWVLNPTVSGLNISGSNGITAPNGTISAKQLHATLGGGGGLTIDGGTSGGILGFTTATTIVSSALLGANQIVLGGGAGTTPSTPLGLGSAHTVLHGNAAGAPAWSAVDLATDVTGLLPAASLSGTISLTTQVSGALPVANGGTGTNAPGATAANNIGALAIASNLSDLNNAGTARTNLGLGTIATENSNAVAITGGAIDGTTLGVTTPAAAKVTTLTATGAVTVTSGTIDGTTIGGSTPAAGTFTTATANSFAPTGSTIPVNGVYLPAANTLGLSSNSAQRAKVDSTGKWTFNAPSSGTGVTINGVDGNPAVLLAGATKGIRIGFSASSSEIDGVDNSGVGSYQPLAISGSTLSLGIAGNFTVGVSIDASGNTKILGNLTNGGTVSLTGSLGVFGATAIAQPTTAGAAAVFVQGAGNAVNDASTFDGYTLKQVVKALRNLGLLA